MKLSLLINRIKDSDFRSLIDSRYGIGYMEKSFLKNWFNPFATVWLNFRSFPFIQALHFPVWVYGRPRLYGLSGKMIISGPVRTGMIKFNIVKPGAPGNMATQSELINIGTIKFSGSCEIGTGNKIVNGYKSILTIGKDSVIMDRCCVACHESIIIGDNTRIAHNCQIMDTNYHFIADLNKRQISKRTGKVFIGAGCWICNSTSIMMGAKVPDYAIVGSNSLVNRDFSQYTNGCIIAGSPAKLIKENYVRVFNTKIENQIWKYWRDNNSDYFPIKDLDIEVLTKYK